MNEYDLGLHTYLAPSNVCEGVGVLVFSQARFGCLLSLAWVVSLVLTVVRFIRQGFVPQLSLADFVLVTMDHLLSRAVFDVNVIEFECANANAMVGFVDGFRGGEQEIRNAGAGTGAAEAAWEIRGRGGREVEGHERPIQRMKGGATGLSTYVDTRIRELHGRMGQFELLLCDIDIDSRDLGRGDGAMCDWCTRHMLHFVRSAVDAPRGALAGSEHGYFLFGSLSDKTRIRAYDLMSLCYTEFGMGRDPRTGAEYTTPFTHRMSSSYAYTLCTIFDVYAYLHLYVHILSVFACDLISREDAIWGNHCWSNDMLRYTAIVLFSDAVGSSVLSPSGQKRSLHRQLPADHAAIPALGKEASRADLPN